jgi:hypothetical protein
MEITRRSRLLDVLTEYPFLEDRIIDVAPPFKNLRNPVMRRAVGRLATIERVAQVGNLEVVDLVNTLRAAAGQAQLAEDRRSEIQAPAAMQGDPDWIGGSPQFVVDGSDLLDQGEVPLERVNALLTEDSPDGLILLVTGFEPSPIIDAMRKQRRDVFHKQGPAGTGQHFTYIRLRRDAR